MTEQLHRMQAYFDGVEDRGPGTMASHTTLQQKLLSKPGMEGGEDSRSPKGDTDVR